MQCFLKLFKRYFSSLGRSNIKLFLNPFIPFSIGGGTENQKKTNKKILKLCFIHVVWSEISESTLKGVQCYTLQYHNLDFGNGIEILCFDCIQTNGV